MTGINKAWSILFRGFPGGNPAYSRHVDPAVFKDSTPMLDALVPPGIGDTLYRSRQADELIGVLSRSSLRGRFLSWDVSNTYEKAVLVAPPSGETYRETTAGTVTIFTQAVDDDLAAEGISHKTFLITIDTVSEELSFDTTTLPYTMTNGLSSHIVLCPGLTIRLRFPTMLSTHQVVYEYALCVNMDWESLLNRIEIVDTAWGDTDLHTIWSSHWLWTERLAAYLLNALEASEHGG
jgi:hypothetical protein